MELIFEIRSVHSISTPITELFSKGSDACSSLSFCNKKTANHAKMSGCTLKTLG